MKRFPGQRIKFLYALMDQEGEGNRMLLEVIRNRLDESGDLKKVKSELRAMILKSVRDGDKSSLNSQGSEDSTSPTQIANHLVMEYLQWIGFQYSMDIFATESGCSQLSSRCFVESKLENKESFDKELPLLLSLTMDLIKTRKE